MRYVICTCKTKCHENSFGELTKYSEAPLNDVEALWQHLSHTSHYIIFLLQYKSLQILNMYIFCPVAQFCFAMFSGD